MQATPGSFKPQGQYGSIEESPADGESTLEQLQEERGSTWVGASFNLTSSIVGAGCIGLGGAVANSGGIVSIVAIFIFSVLSKLSFDLVVELAVDSATYEGLGYLAYGNAGEMTVVVSKGLYSFGSSVAYMVIVKDNLSSALLHFIYGDSSSDESSTLRNILQDQLLVTVFFCTTVMLPLSMLRDLAPLEKFSALKITAVLLIVVIVIYLYAVSEKSPPDFVNHWLVIHGGVFER